MALFGTLGTLSIGLLLYILAKLSERFGTVIKMKPIFRYYYVAAGLVVVSFIAQVIFARLQMTGAISEAERTPLFWWLLTLYYAPLIFALSIGLFVTWRYWSWLVTEREG